MAKDLYSIIMGEPRKGIAKVEICDEPGEFDEHRLENGFTVYIHQRPSYNCENHNEIAL